jgi:NAD(P)-dependent dehydrogenase (short-subunit alcohol dehydrogenase family)
MQLRDKVVLVTGASRGIGAEIARACAREGALVALASRKREALDEVAAGISAEVPGAKLLVRPCHTGDPEQVAALVDAIYERLGPVDVAINNAATNPHFGPLLKATWDQWDKTFDVNVKGYFAVAREVATRLLARGAQGSIVNVASVLGLMGSPAMGVYGMTKAAVVSMTRTLATELGPRGVRVNAIAPGLIETKFAAAIVGDDDLRQGVLNRTSLKRVGQPADVAGAAVFLASDASAYVTGHTLVVDGGWTAS